MITPDLPHRFFFDYKSSCVTDVPYDQHEKLLSRRDTAECYTPLIMLQLRLNSTGVKLVEERYTLSIL